MHLGVTSHLRAGHVSDIPVATPFACMQLVSSTCVQIAGVRFRT